MSTMRRGKRSPAPTSLPPSPPTPATDEAIRDALRAPSALDQSLKFSPEVDYDEDAPVAEGDWPAATIVREVHAFMAPLPGNGRAGFAVWQTLEAERRAAHPDIVCGWRAITLALLATAKRDLGGIQEAMAWRDLARRYIGRSGARRLSDVMVLMEHSA